MTYPGIPAVQYRFASLLEAVAYLALAWSLAWRPPKALPGQLTLGQLILSSQWWAVGIGVGACALLGTALLRPLLLPFAHLLVMVVVAAYGATAFGVSIVNGSGWQVGALCVALAGGHLRAVVPRTDER
ncbi:hypothetical protein [Jatrophihabitans sp.]|uniref:hypothetical protein n=1 Tax=Jatrophihabitans sp. TaxID=1932789 RepID=UPI0030C6E41E|nr:hypothetical protein [Jatrophihabitans sp.]